MVAIAAGAFFIYMVRTESLFGDASAAALLSAITVGICVGFLPWNFYPARIFMGDSGAMLLGMLLTIATISGVGRNPFPPSGGDLAAVVGTVMVPLLVLAIPFLDVALADRPPDVAREGHRPGGQGAHPPPAVGYRAQSPLGRPAHVPLERADLGQRPRDRPDRRTPGRGRHHPVPGALFAVTALPRLARWRGRAEPAADVASRTARRGERRQPFRLNRTRSQPRTRERAAVPPASSRTAFRVTGPAVTCDQLLWHDSRLAQGRGWTCRRSTCASTGSRSSSGTRPRSTTSRSISRRASSSRCSGPRAAGRPPPCG